MPSANETPAPAVKGNYLNTLLEKAKNLPAGKMKELGEEVRGMRKKAAADPEVACYLDILCRSYLSSEASSASLDATFENWQKQQQQQQEEEERKKKEEEEEKARSERKRKAEEDTSQLAPTAPTLPGPVTAYLNPNPDPGCHVSCASSDYHPRKPCPAAVAEKKLAANAARDEKPVFRGASRGPGPHKPRAGDWLCRCSFWNNKYWWACRGKIGHKEGPACEGFRQGDHIVRVQESGPAAWAKV
ncbi:uncharacterized protein J4E79_003085 [Alternaria viburni]|uniref:uncharacterized protein n=1 Tax=Alternaria viburni TaxID=566460 RepID=UPI0020C22696|nr:uncharacterized protein J4E79_003085 [Alternaria viburni]KAI4664787.1 hypothetical protein J4E79_003085 [Alternaria viburni]